MEETKNMNEQKKEYLNGYRRHVRRINRIEAEIAEIREMRASISVNNDGMPSGSNQTDLSAYVAQLDRLERELIEERNNRIITYKDIEKRIKNLKSRNENDVLFYRYIAGLSWWEIAEKLGYSERQIYRMHGKALMNLKIPKKDKDVSECQ